jgi:hypothetical protein
MLTIKIRRDNYTQNTFQGLLYLEKDCIGAIHFSEMHNSRHTYSFWGDDILLLTMWKSTVKLVWDLMPGDQVGSW